MPHDDQPQLYRGSQLELFGGEPAPPLHSTADEMRAYLHELLAEARAAKTVPITADRGLFAQLSYWLPEEERAQLRLEFEAELARLEAA
ncbi:MAG TPA: hypothetical protein VGF29_21175 [Hyphomicrobiaceae bacterium]|jgi:hypothetical protein